MEQYLSTMGQILNHGHDHVDRTGVGRRSIFGVMMRFDMKEGFPLVTTKHVAFKTMVRETLWFLTGSKSTLPLREKNTTLWDRWAVSEKDIDAFIAKHSDKFNDSEDEVKAYMMSEFFGSIGPMYGAAWRNTTQQAVSKFLPLKRKDQIASDKYNAIVKVLESKFNGPYELSDEDRDEFISFSSYMSGVDQIQDLINNLKERPYSSRHVVVAWNPATLPFEDLSPQENVLMRRSALAACHFAFQCFVSPPETEGGKKRLSLKVDIR